MQSIIDEAGRIDILVNNAGYSLNGAFEDLAMEELRPSTKPIFLVLQE